MITVQQHQIVIVDITKDDTPAQRDHIYPDAEVPVYTGGGSEEGVETLHMRGLTIKMTTKQMEELRFYFENT